MYKKCGFPDYIINEYFPNFTGEIFVYRIKISYSAKRNPPELLLTSRKSMFLEHRLESKILDYFDGEKANGFLEFYKVKKPYYLIVLMLEDDAQNFPKINNEIKLILAFSFKLKEETKRRIFDKYITLPNRILAHLSSKIYT